MQAEVLTHLSLQDLFSGTCLVSKTLHALTHKEVQRRLKHDVFRALPPSYPGPGSGWDEYMPSTSIFDDKWIKIRRNLLASASWRSRCDWRRSSLQCDWVYTLWLAQATMIQDIFFEADNGQGGVIRAFSPARHGTTGHWYLIERNATGDMSAVPSPGLPQHYHRVFDALRALNGAFLNLQCCLVSDDEAVSMAIGRVVKAVDNLFHVSFMDLDLDLTLSYDGWQMGRATLWRMVPEQGVKVGV
jgi:hypothetical protein